MCGGYFAPSFAFTEFICEDCQEAEHDVCDDWTEEACACRNSDHTLDNRASKQAAIDMFMKAAYSNR